MFGLGEMVGPTTSLTLEWITMPNLVAPCQWCEHELRVKRVFRRSEAEPFGLQVHSNSLMIGALSVRCH